MGTLKVLPCLDSEERGLALKRILDIPGWRAAELGRTALEAARNGFYLTPEGRKVAWGNLVQAAIAAKISIPPEAELPSAPHPSFPQTEVQVANETTLEAGLRLSRRGLVPLALNFANGIHPGGGFLSGARAQEETLCQSSALYVTLEGDPMYAAHRQRPLPDATDWAILSPRVPVFRSDDGRELDEPWLLDFISCAAPYAPALGVQAAGELLGRKIHRVLAIARAYGYRDLVLGAWGCGAFGNDPWRTARDFRSALEQEFAGAFHSVVFAIADWSKERRFLKPFASVWGG